VKEAEEQRRSGVPVGGKRWSVRARSLEPWSSLYAYYCFDGLVPLGTVSSSLDGRINGSRLAITGFAGLCEAPPPTWPLLRTPWWLAAEWDKRRREAEG
jgi:hypothetical protein